MKTTEQIIYKNPTILPAWRPQDTESQHQEKFLSASGDVIYFVHQRAVESKVKYKLTESAMKISK